jgi:dTDP-4-dehydrorhamnose reductase
MKILVTGANGQLGKEFQKISKHYPNFEFKFADRAQLDINSLKSKDEILAIAPQIIINCAAYTAVDLAEDEIDQAMLINMSACNNLVAACKVLNIPIIHFSSDYVYHILKEGPLLESDETSPKGNYALSKLEGEKIISQYKKHIIIRTSWVYGCEGKNFFKTMLSLKDRDQLTIVSDQIGAPTYANDIARMTMDITENILQSSATNLYGTYNFSNEGAISWYDFAQAIFQLVDSPIKLEKTTTKAYNAKAPRPLWSVLSKVKIKKSFKIQIPHWHDALRRCYAEYLELTSSS